jgi:hypothetical protein
VRELAKVSLDLWLLGQQAPDARLPDGLAYQAAVARTLWRPGMRCVQQAGVHVLWGLRSASGTAHELDAAGRAGGAAYLIEAKARASLTKADLAVFELKASDYYFGRWKSVIAHAWWMILASAGPTDDASRRLAAHRAIILVEPNRLPIPVLHHHCRHPASRGLLPQTLCREFLRLSPRALQPLQERYVPDLTSDRLVLEPCPYSATELDDLLFLQCELTDEVLARYDRLAPGRLEARAARLLRYLRGSAGHRASVTRPLGATGAALSTPRRKAQSDERWPAPHGRRSPSLPGAARQAPKPRRSAPRI